MWQCFKSFLVVLITETRDAADFPVMCRAGPTPGRGHSKALRGFPVSLQVSTKVEADRHPGTDKSLSLVSSFLS